jgi:ferritin-like metal-binding protein YciE
MAEKTTLKELFVDELRDLYDDEHQLIKALPKMAKEARNEELRSGIEHHLEQTKEHAQRLGQIFDAIGLSPKGKKCKGVRGIIAEGKEVVSEDWAGPVKDSAIIGAAQRVEHYEIAAYGTVREFAEMLGEKEAVSLLERTLEEEKETDRKLTEIAHKVNREASENAPEGEARVKRRARSAGA